MKTGLYTAMKSARMQGSYNRIQSSYNKIQTNQLVILRALKDGWR